MKFTKYLTEADNLEITRDVLKNKTSAKIKSADGKKISMDIQTADVLTKVYDALKKPEMKKRFEKMLNGNASQIKKLIDFSEAVYTMKMI